LEPAHKVILESLSEFEGPETQVGPMTKRVLIVDDNLLLRRQVRTLLATDLSIEVCAEAADGVEAVQKAVECAPDLAVMDVVMPRMNGLEATRAIKRLVPTVHVLIFALDVSPVVEHESMQAGADAVLAKAKASGQLSKLIHSLLD
jgi:DNA-binding NarL/FixJ family response regulator